MLVLQAALWSLGLALDILILSALLRGMVRTHVFPFFYVVGLFLTTNVEIAASFLGRRELYIRYYWINEIIMQALTFCVVVSFVYRATGNIRQMEGVRRVLVPAAALAFVAPFALHYDPSAKVSGWMTTVSRDLYFLSAVLDLFLWFTLLAAKRKDWVLLLLSGGFGIEFAGSAMAHSLRTLFTSVPIIRVVNLLVPLSHLTHLFVWWRAFRHAASSANTSPAPLPAPPSRR